MAPRSPLDFAALLSLFALLVLFSQLAGAHFAVITPPALGTNIDNEDQGPCGGFTPTSSDNITDFHVGGDAIAITTLHAQSNIAFFGMLGTTLSPANWTLLFPMIQQYGLNGFCEPSVPTPASWAGSSGMLQIVQDAEDGVHFQCMHVNFVSGVGTANPACTNSSGNSAAYMADPVLATVDSQSQSNPVQSTSSSTAPALSSQSSSPSKSGASSRAEFICGKTYGIMMMGLLAILIGL